MERNIIEREKKGIKQDETRTLLASILKAQENQTGDQISVRALKLYTELMVEVNAQLQLFKLPEATFGKYRELIRRT